MKTLTNIEEVTIDRISSSGNPIAEPKDVENHIHVPDGEVGKKYEVEIHDIKGLYVGIISEMSDERAKAIKKKYKKQQGIARKKSVTNKKFKTGKSTESQKEDRSVKYGGFPEKESKNDLLNGKL